MKTTKTTNRRNANRGKKYLIIAIIIAIMGVLTPVILIALSNNKENIEIPQSSSTVSTTNEFVETHEEELGILDNVLLSDTIPPEVEKLAFSIQSNAGSLTIRQRQRYAICCLNADDSTYYRGGAKVVDGSESVVISRENLRIAKSVLQKHSTPTEWEEFCSNRFITPKTVISSKEKTANEGFSLVLVETFEFNGSTQKLYYYEDKLDSTNTVCKKLHTYD